MKMVVAVIKPFKLDEIYHALLAIGVDGMTVTEAYGFGRQKGATETYRGAEFAVNSLPRLRVEIAIPDDMEKKVIRALQDAATTGRIGDGKIFIYDLSSVTRIRTGESGVDAL